MKVGIYDRWYPALGGGERMALALAECLAADHPVDFIAHHAIDLDRAAARLNLDLRRVRLRCLPERLRDEEYAPLTRDYDLFIAASQSTFIPAQARHNWLLTFFPYPIELSAAARLRRRVGEWLRRELHVPEYLRGFYGREDGVRWTDGHGVLRVPLANEAVDITLAVATPEPTTLEVRVNGIAHYAIDLRPEQGFTPIAATLTPGADQSATLELINAPGDQPIGRDRRSVGVAVRELLIDHPRYQVYQQVFEERFKHWGLRLLNVPSDRGAAALRTYTHILAISEFTRYWIRRYWSRDSELLYPPVAVEAFAPRAKRNLILTAGRLFAGGHNKKHIPMIVAFKQLVDGGLRDWEFHIAGNVGVERVDRDYFRQVQAAARGYPIVLHPNASADELKALYGAAKIYWHASGYGEDEQRDPIKFEHFGITTVEAMAAGAVPVVIGKAGQREVIEPETSGLHWRTLKELEAQTRRVIADDALWARLSRGAIERSRAFSRAAFDARVRALMDGLR